MRLTSVTIVAILFVFHHAAFGEVGKFCTNPWGHNGTCRILSTCSPLCMLIIYGDKQAYDIIRRSVCDFAGMRKIQMEPTVCCPWTDNYEIKYNGANDDADNKDDTEKKPNSPYGPILEPVCGRPLEPRTEGFFSFVGYQPWATVLGYLGKTIPNTIDWSCGGSLISSRHVLTAAHCVYEQPTLFLVRVGDIDLESDDEGAYPVDVLIEKRTVHPQFDASAHVNDIAVLRLQDHIQFSAYIQPICLPVPAALRKANLVGKYSYAIGWGDTDNNGSRSSKLGLVDLPIVSEGLCKDAYREFRVIKTIDERIVCAGDLKRGAGTCNGDSGGPLIVSTAIAFYVVGVSSYAYKCGEPGYPSIFTRVTSFLDFIESQLN